MAERTWSNCVVPSEHRRINEFGGLVGTMLAESLQHALNPAGTIVVLLASFLVSLFLSTTFSFSSAIVFLTPRLHFVSVLAERWAERKATKAAKAEAERKEKTPKKQLIITDKPNVEPPASADAVPSGKGRREGSGEGLIAAAPKTKAGKPSKATAATNAEFPST